jgi:hypothetical protein
MNRNYFRGLGKISSDTPDTRPIDAKGLTGKQVENITGAEPSWPVGGTSATTSCRCTATRHCATAYPRRFNFTTVEPGQLKELAAVTKKGIAGFKNLKLPWA